MYLVEPAGFYRPRRPGWPRALLRCERAGLPMPPLRYQRHMANPGRTTGVFAVSVRSRSEPGGARAGSLVKSPRGSRPTSSAKKQKSSCTRKCAVRRGVTPRACGCAGDASREATSPAGIQGSVPLRLTTCFAADGSKAVDRRIAGHDTVILQGDGGIGIVNAANRCPGVAKDRRAVQGEIGAIPHRDCP